ncbi:hypothetical protein PAHAL_5G187600 [Panicum hallii]|uniref:Uncharacterized protein n=1 Tax=Panicum hallii TaxID=206008 RepID=A0A2T8IKK0_9POAL|nr:hypothetical protein PAHAL_5G187600 [Panicum hallii]
MVNAQQCPLQPRFNQVLCASSDFISTRNRCVACIFTKRDVTIPLYNEENKAMKSSTLIYKIRNQAYTVLAALRLRIFPLLIQSSVLCHAYKNVEISQDSEQINKCMLTLTGWTNRSTHEFRNITPQSKFLKKY